MTPGKQEVRSQKSEFRTRAVAWHTVAIALLPVVAAPQSGVNPDSSLKFEVASIKVATSGINGVRGGCRGIDSAFTAKQIEQGGAPPLGRCVITDGRLSHLIGIAWGVSMQDLSTGPDWIQRGDLRFDVQAKAEDPAKATEKQLLAMLQNLLVERFQMKFHYENKDQSGFALVVAKSGPKLQKSTKDEVKVSFTGAKGEALGKPAGRGAMTMTAQKFSIAKLLELISAFGDLGPGVDNTGLIGDYDFTLSWSEEDGPPLAVALRDQLGLQVRAGKVPVATFVVDSAEKPKSN